MTPHDIYLETQVTTATPQRLRLMLIEAAIRWAHVTVEHWRLGRQAEAFEPLIRCREIISELMSGVQQDASPLSNQVLGLYSFLFNALTAAQNSRSITSVEEVIGILEEERQTWSLVCEQLVDAPARSRALDSREERAPMIVSSAAASAGLSLDA
jgi:flagellar secretion chaperone FliS